VPTRKGRICATQTRALVKAKAKAATATRRAHDNRFAKWPKAEQTRDDFRRQGAKFCVSRALAPPEKNLERSGTRILGGFFKKEGIVGKTTYAGRRGTPSSRDRRIFWKSDLPGGLAETEQVTPRIHGFENRAKKKKAGRGTDRSANRTSVLSELRPRARVAGLASANWKREPESGMNHARKRKTDAKLAERVRNRRAAAQSKRKRLNPDGNSVPGGRTARKSARRKQGAAAWEKQNSCVRDGAKGSALEKQHVNSGSAGRPKSATAKEKEGAHLRRGPDRCGIDTPPKSGGVRMLAWGWRRGDGGGGGGGAAGGAGGGRGGAPANTLQETISDRLDCAAPRKKA